MKAWTYFQFKAILEPTGWRFNAVIGVDEQGIIQYVHDDAPQGVALEVVSGYAVPGFQNAHCHAFQYAMAALAENHPLGVDDDFWSWREAMYQCALTVNPDQAEAIATMLYAEMVRLGYTHVAEFHYLHHDKNGQPYANISEMGERMIAAAQSAGIGITLIPVFYQMGGFGQAPQLRQRRFISKNTDAYLTLVEASQRAINKNDHAQVGWSVHSLRAVTMPDIVTTYQACPSNVPFHLHIAEQQKEVDDCIQYSGMRPLHWLSENIPLSNRLHLVHATHLDDDELKRTAQSGAHVILCPSTEGNLGDGFFRMKEYANLGGRWAIGTDSNICINPWEELRMIDYRQRLLTHRRNTFSNDAAQYMVCEALQSGWHAMGKPPAFFHVGAPFHAVVADAHAPLLSCTSLKNMSATLVYASDPAHFLGTLVHGKWVVKNGHHVDEQRIRTNFKKAMHALQIR